MDKCLCDIIDKRTEFFKGIGDIAMTVLGVYVADYVKMHSRKDSYLYINYLFDINVINKQQYNLINNVIKNAIIQ